MGELELVGLHEDGEHLVLAAPDGQRYRLRIDEELRAAVRRDRAQLEGLRGRSAGALSPREIQGRIRAGETAEQVAAGSGTTVEQVRRFEGPVLAERGYVAEQARSARIGHEAGSPALGDLVADRLVARGTDVTTLTWDAYREALGPWTVVARFEVDAQVREARWAFEPSTRALQAAEDEARWLSETDLDQAPARRHLSAVRHVVFELTPSGEPASAVAAGEPSATDPQVADGPDAAARPPATDTADLLDELGNRRGRRQPVEALDDDDEFEGFGPQRAFDLGGPDRAAEPRSVVSAPHPEVTGEVPAVGDDEARSPRRRRGRAKVPSWDEIVFGAKPE